MTRYLFSALIAGMIMALSACQSEPEVNSSTIPAEADTLEVLDSVIPIETSTEKEPATQFIEDWPRDYQALTLDTIPIQLQNGDSFDLRGPKGWRIRPVAENFGRPRFLAKSPDDRLFMTDMKNRSDNERGKILILEGFDNDEGDFDTVITYLDRLRNPNSIAFHTDTNHVYWLYVALTDRLIRYRYVPGEIAPTSEPELIDTFPDYGLSYKYGGWHLTRTIAIHNERLYVSVGSSCNVCEEKESVRASVLEMDLDGKNRTHYAFGVRNAVGLKWVQGRLFSSNMGADHLGDDKPEEALYELERNRHYGWPYYYETEGEIHADTSFTWQNDTLDKEEIPLAYAALGSHSAPLGFHFFEGQQWPSEIQNYFLVALHGSGYTRIGAGYNIVRTVPGHAPEPVIDGWLQNKHRYGRPCDVFPYDHRSFFVTDDHGGVLYYVELN